MGLIPYNETENNPSWDRDDCELYLETFPKAIYRNADCDVESSACRQAVRADENGLVLCWPNTKVESAWIPYCRLYNLEGSIDGGKTWMRCVKYGVSLDMCDYRKVWGPQKYHFGDLVRIADERHYRPGKGERAIVVGSYKDQCGGTNVESYSLYVEGYGDVSWYDEKHLTLIAAGSIGILKEWLGGVEAYDMWLSTIRVRKTGYAASLAAAGGTLQF